MLMPLFYRSLPWASADVEGCGAWGGALVHDTPSIIRCVPRQWVHVATFGSPISVTDTASVTGCFNPLVLTMIAVTYEGL